MKMVKLDIYSDIICPWCYIGKTNLDRALEKAGDHPFDIEWHPYQLNPDMPAEGMDRTEYLYAKFGDKDGFLKAYMPIQTHADKIGLKINLGAIKRTPNTLDAHRLIEWARVEGKQTRMVSALFKSYFTLGQDISDHKILGEIASSIDMDFELIERLLASDDMKEEIISRDQDARKMGISGVPCFIVNDLHAISGAQTSEFWLGVIDDINENFSSTFATT